MARSFQQTDANTFCTSTSQFCSATAVTTGTPGSPRNLVYNGTAGTSEVTITMDRAVDESAGVGWMVTSDELGLTSWDSGSSQTIRLDVTSGNSNITWEAVYVCRVSTGCSNLATVASSTGLGISCTTGVKSTTVTWSAQASTNSTDKFAVVYVFSNSQAHSNEAFGVTPSQLIDTPLNFPVSVTPARSDLQLDSTAPSVEISGIVQRKYRWRNDDGDEANASWLAAADTDPGSGVFTRQKPFRLRFLLENTGAGALSVALYKFQYKRNAGAWTQISEFDTYVRSLWSDGKADRNPPYTCMPAFAKTTQQIGSGTHHDDNAGFTLYGDLWNYVSDLPAGNELEVECAFEFTTSNATTDTFEFRIADNSGNAIQGYDVTPSITLTSSSTAKSNLTQNAYRWQTGDCDPNDPTYLAAINTAVDVIADDEYQCRFVVQNTTSAPYHGETTTTPADHFIVEYQRNGGAWTNVSTTDTYVRPYTGQSHTSGPNDILTKNTILPLSVKTGNPKDLLYDPVRDRLVFFFESGDGTNTWISSMYSDDGGANWSSELNIRDTTSQNISRCSVCYDYKDGDFYIYYEISNVHYMLHSTDGCESWDEKVIDGFEDISISGAYLLAYGENLNIVHARTDSGFVRPHTYRSSDGGATWSLEVISSGSSNTSCIGATMSPVDGSIAGYYSFVGGSSTNYNIFYSNDDGVSWTSSAAFSTIENATSTSGQRFCQSSFDDKSAFALRTDNISIAQKPYESFRPAVMHAGNSSLVDYYIVRGTYYDNPQAGWGGEPERSDITFTKNGSPVWAAWLEDTAGANDFDLCYGWLEETINQNTEVLDSNGANQATVLYSPGVSTPPGRDGPSIAATRDGVFVLYVDTQGANNVIRTFSIDKPTFSGINIDQKIGSGDYGNHNKGFLDTNKMHSYVTIGATAETEFVCRLLFTSSCANNDTFNIRVKGLGTYNQTAAATFKTSGNVYLRSGPTNGVTYINAWLDRYVPPTAELVLTSDAPEVHVGWKFIVPTAQEDGPPFDSSISSGAFTYSNNDFTVTKPSGDGSADSTWTTDGSINLTSGKYYVEFYVDAWTANDIHVGVCTSDQTTTDELGAYTQATYAIGYRNNNGYLYSSENVGPGGAYGDTWGQGDVISFLIDYSAGTVSAWVNGIDQGVGYSDVPAEILYPAVSMRTAGTDSTVTIRTGREDWRYYPTPGYEPWVINGEPGLILDSQAPSINIGRECYPAVADLVLSTDAPTYEVSTGVAFEPVTGDLILSSVAPEVSVGVLSLPAAVDLALSTTASTVIVDWYRKPDAAQAGAGTALDTSYNSATITYSNNDYTATFGSVLGMTISNDGAVDTSGGKYYCEVYVNAGGSNVGLIGVGETGSPESSYLGGTAGGYYHRGYFALDGQKYSNGSGTSYGATWTTGDIISILVDYTANELIFWKNGVSQGVAFSDFTTEVLHPGVSSGGGGANGEIFTLRTSQSDWTYTPPAGYVPWYDANGDGGLRVDSVAPATQIDRGFDVTAANLLLDSLAPTLGDNVSETPAEGNLVLDSQAPAADIDYYSYPASADVVLDSQAPAADIDYYSYPASADVVLDSQAPTYGVGWFLMPATSDLLYSSTAPALDFSYNITSDAGQLTYSGTAPSVDFSYTITPAAGDLVLTAPAPSTGESINTVVDAAQAVLDSQAPEIFTALTIEVAATSLSLTSAQPAVDIDYFEVPDVAQLTITSVAPEVGNLYEPAQENLLLSSAAPSVTTTLIFIPAANDFTLEAIAPSHIVNGNYSNVVVYGSLVFDSAAVALSIDFVPIETDGESLVLYEENVSNIYQTNSTDTTTVITDESSQHVTVISEDDLTDTIIFIESLNETTVINDD